MIKANTHIQKILPEILDVRKQLHQIPELKYEEFKTAELIAEKLKSYGYDVKKEIAKTGLVAILDTGKPGKTIGLRADMDALPLEEPEDFAYRSEHPGKMHACGHDGHCATALAVAYALHQIKDELCGKVKFIFQPAEEGGKGSTAMIDAGVLENPTINEIYGFHNWPGLPEGIVATKAGTILVGNGRFEITINGKPAHTAQPQNAINPVTIGAQLITALDELRLSLDQNTTVLNIISFNSGEFKRGMSDKGHIVGVYYVETENDLEKIKFSINKICNNIAGAKTEINISFTPFHSPTINTAKESDLILNVAKEIYGDTKVKTLDKSMIASEDFSEYLRHVPGCFFLVGAGESASSVHTNQFQFNDSVISIAANVFCQTIINSLLSS
ncbi:MAG: M20 family metallopeptidase [Gammaproteobacteria bacterium]